MQIIPRQEFQLDCRSTGQQLEQMVMARDPPQPLTVEEIDEVFEPLIDKVEQRTEAAVRREIDEEQGRVRDRAESAARASMYSNAKAEILDKVRIFVNDDECRSTSAATARALKRAHDDGWWAITSYEVEDAKADLDHLDDPVEILSYDSTDDHWDDFVENIFVDLSAPYDELLGATQNQVVNYINRSNLTPSQTLELLRSLNKYRIPEFTYYLDGMIQMAEWAVGQRCQMVLAGGKRRGSLCERPAKRRKKCNYHLRKESDGYH